MYAAGLERKNERVGFFVSNKTFDRKIRDSLKVQKSITRKLFYHFD